MGRPAGGGKPGKIEEADEALAGILKSLAPDGGWVVKIYRRRGGEQEWLADRDKDEVSEQMIASTWGPGRFLVRAWSTEKLEWAKAKTVVISAEAAGEAGFDFGSGATPMAPAQGGMDKDVLAMMQGSSDRMMQMMMASSNMQIQSMQAMMSGLTTVLAAAMGSNKSYDPIALFQAMQGAGGNQMAMLKDAVGLVKDIGGGGDDPAWLKVFSMAGKFLESRQAAPSPVPANNPPAQIAATSEAKKEEVPVAVDPRKEFFLKLKAQALKNDESSVDFWAEYIERNPDEPGPRWILQMVHSFEWSVILKNLTSADADIQNEPYVTWFEALYLLIKTPAESEEAE